MDMGECGGCQGQGQGSHRKHCRQNPLYSRELEWADQADALGDQIGPNNMAASGLLWRVAGILRQAANVTINQGTSHES